VIAARPRAGRAGQSPEGSRPPEQLYFLPLERPVNQMHGSCSEPARSLRPRFRVDAAGAGRSCPGRLSVVGSGDPLIGVHRRMDGSGASGPSGGQPSGVQLPEPRSYATPPRGSPNRSGSTRLPDPLPPGRVVPMTTRCRRYPRHEPLRSPRPPAPRLRRRARSRAFGEQRTHSSTGRRPPVATIRFGACGCEIEGVGAPRSRRLRTPPAAAPPTCVRSRPCSEERRVGIVHGVRSPRTTAPHRHFGRSARGSASLSARPSRWPSFDEQPARVAGPRDQEAAPERFAGNRPEPGPGRPSLGAETAHVITWSHRGQTSPGVGARHNFSPTRPMPPPRGPRRFR